MSLYPAVVNTYGYVGEEFRDVCSVIDKKNAKFDAENENNLEIHDSIAKKMLTIFG